MYTDEFENLYECVKYTKRTVRYLPAVVDYLKTHVRKPRTCAEIGKGVFGDRYNAYYDMSVMRIEPAEVASILRHLVDGGYVKSEVIDDEPWTWEDRVWITDPINGINPTIKVYSWDNNEWYEIENPAYLEARRKSKTKVGGHWETVTKTKPRTKRVYTWVGK